MHNAALRRCTDAEISLMGPRRVIAWVGSGIDISEPAFGQQSLTAQSAGSTNRGVRPAVGAGHIDQGEHQ